MSEIPVENLAILVPIVAIIFGCTLFGCFLLFRHLRRARLLRAYHEESMAALAKGVPMTPWPTLLLSESDPRAAHPARALLKGLVWSFMGLAIFFALRQFDRQAALFALIPIAVGLAYLTFYWLEGRKAEPANPEINDKAPPAPVADLAKV